MSGRFRKFLVGAVVAFATMALPFTATANAAPTLRDCANWADGANRAWFMTARDVNWRRDPGPGGCIAVTQTFINDTFGYAQFFAASPNGAAARRALFGIDLSWWPLRADGVFGEQTRKAVQAYRLYEDASLSVGSSVTAKVLRHMNTRCQTARTALGYRTTACAMPRPTGPN